MRDYVLRLIERDLQVASLSEWAESLRRSGPIATGVDADQVVAAIEQGRTERDLEIAAALEGRRGEGDAPRGG